MGTLWQDLRYGVRMLARSPGFTAVVVLLLGIGMGATTVMLSVVDAVLLRPCPYQDSDRLVCLYETDSTTRTKRNFTSRAGFEDWRQRNHVFSHLIGANQHDLSVQSGNGTDKTRAMFVSPEFFSVLGARPVLGRTFLPEEERRGGARVAVLSYTHWQRWFAGDPNAIGKPLTVEGQVYVVVGVLPPDFRWIFQRWACGLWLPMALHPDQGVDRRWRGLQALGRLRPDTSLAQAQAEMDLIAAQLAREYPDTVADDAIALVPVNEDFVRGSIAWGKPRTLVLLLAIVGAVLLIACLHVASLLIARAAAREQEMVVRAALGAHRFRLVRQMLTESLLLASAGALLGLVLAYWGLGALAVVRSRHIPWYGGSDQLIPWFVQVSLDGRVLLYGAGISLLTCALFGTLPALGASAIHLSRCLSLGRAPAYGPRFQGLRTLLVVGDIAIAVVLLTGAGLMIHSFVRIVNIDPGYNPRDVLDLSVVLDADRPPYAQPQARLAFLQEVLPRIRVLPGVQSVTAASDNPVRGTGNVRAFKVEGVVPDAGKYRIPAFDNQLPDKNYLWFPFWEIWPDYFRVVQIPLLQGRYFTDQDGAASPRVAIVNEALARAFWPNRNPIGQYLFQAPARGATGPTALEIVGVVTGVKHFGRSEPSDPEVYIPYLQSGYTNWIDLMIRVDRGRPDIASAVRQAILSVDRDVAIYNVGLMDREVSSFFSSQRILTLCLGGFALAALALACLGVYGATAYAVSRRTQEIGIRMALGARRRDIMAAVLQQGLKLTGIGLVLGLLGAGAAARVIRRFLYDVRPTDPLTFVCVALLLAGVALLACYLPARRAARIDPMVALRYE